MTYILDTNTLIAPKNEYYGMDFCPGYWDWLLHLASHNKIILIDQVCFELIGDSRAGGRQEDELSKWAKDNKRIFMPTDTAIIQSHYAGIVRYVESIKDQFNEGASDKFLNGADPWLIATAQSIIDSKIVSFEKFRIPGTKRYKEKVQLPNISAYCGVTHVEYWDFMKDADLQAFFTFDPENPRPVFADIFDSYDVDYHTSNL